MSEISITLNQDYRSFNKDFETTLMGNLIILSGVNGSGKSQLINIINGSEKKENEDRFNENRIKIQINRDVSVNKVIINSENIEYRSFKENIKLPEVTKSNSVISTQGIDQAYKLYTSGKLDPKSTPNYASSCSQARLILENKFDNIDNSISELEFKTTLRENNFIWRNDDLLADFIGAIFFNHAMKITQGQIEAGKINGPAFDEFSLGVAPWDELNDLFRILNLEYRFKDNYELYHSELNETPSLYQIDKQQNIIENEKRTIKDLSDGEKTIIALCFTSLRKIEGEDKKLLLLDELDAVLNPSLIENLFIILQKYYLDKGIIVIMTTHSPATISLAPENTNYYEVFKKNQLNSRIIEVSRDEYKELQKVNKKFYDKIENQAQRIFEFESVLDSSEDKLIITEGKTDWKYILAALDFFHLKGEFKDIKKGYFYKFGTKEDVEQNICGTNVIADLGESELNRFLSNEIALRTGNVDKRKKIWIGIFDSDTDIKIKNKPEYGVYSFKIEPVGISTEFLFNENEIRTKIKDKRLFIGNEFNERSTRHLSEDLNLGLGSQKRAGKKEIVDCDVFNNKDENQSLSKELFSQAIYNGDIHISEESWENFRHIFDEINIFLNK